MIAQILRFIFQPHSFLTVILGLYKLKQYRKFWGGHWELWYVDYPICSEIWHDVKKCSFETNKRPNALLRGTPTCEHYD